jgi:hypothetical protein
MAFDPRRMDNLEVAGIVSIMLSAAVVVGLLYSIWQ